MWGGGKKEEKIKFDLIRLEIAFNVREVERDEKMFMNYIKSQAPPS